MADGRNEEMGVRWQMRGSGWQMADVHPTQQHKTHKQCKFYNSH